MELWQRMIRDSVHTVDQLVEKFGIDRKVAEEHNLKVKSCKLVNAKAEINKFIF